MAEQGEHRARRMWRAVEPIHAVTYFAPEPKAACEALGTRGYWMGYFAQRAAPLGAVPPELVAALFYNFHPALVARAVPDVWAVATPERYLAVRLDAVDAAPTGGRALAAANAALEWPRPPHLVLWHAQTVLREHRGDGHVAALLTAGLDPVEALVLFAADLGLDAAWLRQRRGWSEQDWDAASARLAARGLVDLGPTAAGPTAAGPTAAGATAAGSAADAPRPIGPVVSAAGRELRAEVEAHTDALADAPWAAVGPRRAERLVELATPLVAGIVAGEAFLAENPMGLRLLSKPG